MGVLTPTVLEGLDVSHANCAPACALFDLPDVHVRTIERHRSSFTLVVETVPSLVGCPFCGVLAVGHGRVAVLLHDLPCAGVPVRVVWRKRRYRCHEKACEATTFSEVHELAAPRAKLTSRAIAWAVFRPPPGEMASPASSGKGCRTLKAPSSGDVPPVIHQGCVGVRVVRSRRWCHRRRGGPGQRRRRCPPRDLLPRRRGPVPWAWCGCR